MSLPPLAVTDLLSWLCSLSSILSVYFSARRLLLGPLLGILGFVPWTALAIATGQWGLLPATIVVTVLQARIFLLWRVEDRP